MLRIMGNFVGFVVMLGPGVVVEACPRADATLWGEFAGQQKLLSAYIRV